MSSDALPQSLDTVMNGHATFSEDSTPPGGEIHHPTDRNGWDGKLRVTDLRTSLPSPEGLSDVDPSHSDDDCHPADQIAADEGKYCC